MNYRFAPLVCFYSSRYFRLNKLNQNWLMVCFVLFILNKNKEQIASLLSKVKETRQIRPLLKELKSTDFGIR